MSVTNALDFLQDWCDTTQKSARRRNCGRIRWRRRGLVFPDGIEPDTGYENRPYIEMKTADDQLVPWVASQTDMLAEDWETVEY